MLILASNSQTRAKILKSFGVKFKQMTCNFDEENIKVNSPKEFVYKATFGKMQSFMEEFKPKEPFICADTVVTCDDKILRKAKNKNEAREILKLQSANEVKILTCMIYKDKSLSLFDLSSTIYEFEKFDETKMEQYLNTSEWEDKAGACMIEGFCKPYIKSVNGYESTAMGLCVEKLIQFLS